MKDDETRELAGMVEEGDQEDDDKIEEETE